MEGHSGWKNRGGGMESVLMMVYVILSGFVLRSAFDVSQAFLNYVASFDVVCHLQIM